MRNLSFFLFLWLLSTKQLHAKVTGFNDAYAGVSMGAGIYQKWLPYDNAYDPLPGMAPAGTKISGSDKIHLIPAKLGYFRNFGLSQFETYFRYMLNTRKPYKSTGSVDGEGFITFRSYGLGANFSGALYRRPSFQTNLVFNGEYVLERAKLSHDSSSEGSESLNIGSTALLAGIGIQPEFWLGDLWVLSVFSGYQYGFVRYWKALETGSYLGVDYTEGKELLTRDGDKIISQFGGFLFEVTLKLNFY